MAITHYPGVTFTPISPPMSMSKAIKKPVQKGLIMLWTIDHMKRDFLWQLKCGAKNYIFSFCKTLKSVCRVFQQAGKTSPSQEEAEITTANVLAGGHIKQVLFSGQHQQSVETYCVCLETQQLIGEMFKTQVASIYAQYLWKTAILIIYTSWLKMIKPV